MPQHDMIIDNAPGLAVRTDMNAAIAALATLSSGPVEPGTMYAGQLWLDTSMTPPVIRQRNAANGAWTFPSVETLNVAGSGPSGDYPVKANGVDSFLLSAAAATAHIGLGDLLALRKRTADAVQMAYQFLDASGVLRGELAMALSPPAAGIVVRDAAGASVQQLSIDATLGAQLTTGANAGQVITTGNMAALQTNAATGSSETAFPITTTVLVQHSGSQPRGNPATVRIDAGDTGKYQLGAGTALAGSWRARGAFSATGGGWSVLFQRVS